MINNVFPQRTNLSFATHKELQMTADLRQFKYFHTTFGHITFAVISQEGGT